MKIISVRRADAKEPTDEINARWDLSDELKKALQHISKATKEAGDWMSYWESEECKKEWGVQRASELKQRGRRLLADLDSLERRYKEALSQTEKTLSSLEF